MMAAWSDSTAPVPPRYRGVWRRSLLREPGRPDDRTTTVYWLQTSRWHADLRIPAGRPDFSGVDSLADCSAAQLEWLRQQQGFAGVTTVEPATGLTHWQRRVDFQPPAVLPDAGYAQFARGMLVETGVHVDYVEHWHLEPQTRDGFAVLYRNPPSGAEWLLTAGVAVIHVRARTVDFTTSGWGPGDALRAQLDFEISYGVRTPTGWRILHSTLPWREGRALAVEITTRVDDTLELVVDGVTSRWQILEWTPPGAA